MAAWKVHIKFQPNTFFIYSYDGVKLQRGSSIAILMSKFLTFFSVAMGLIIFILLGCAPPLIVSHSEDYFSFSIYRKTIHFYQTCNYEIIAYCLTKFC